MSPRRRLRVGTTSGRLAVLAMPCVLVLAACGGGGGGSGKGGPPAAAGGHAGGGSNSSDTGGGGPPAGVGNGHVPPGAGAGGGAGGPGATPDRSPDKLRPGVWKLGDFSGQIVAHVSAPCAATAVAYDPLTDPAQSYFNLTGDGRVKFFLTWAQPGASATTPTQPNMPTPTVSAKDPPDGTTTWDQTAGLKGKSDDGALTLSGTFDTPSQLVGKWQYNSTTPLGSCVSRAAGQGTFTAQPS